MDALRKQASKLKVQVAKQQQAVIKQFGGTGYESSDVMVIDEAEMQRHQQLERLYRSTRAGRDFQKDIVKAGEAFTAIGYRHIETGNKLSEDCCNYGANNINENILAKAASIYGDARKHVEKEQEDLIKLLSSQILDPLRAMIAGPPLEDARHLAQRYSRMRQEAELLAAEISRRRARVREFSNPENVAKLHASEAKMQELKANMAVLGKEASAALAAVEAQQQRLTLQRLVAMVEGEKTYHLRVAAILGEVETEMVTEKQRKESAPPLISSENHSQKSSFFLAEGHNGMCCVEVQPRIWIISRGGASLLPQFGVVSWRRLGSAWRGAEIFALYLRKFCFTLPLGIRGESHGILVFLLVYGLYGLREMVRFLGEERSCEEFWEGVRFYSSLWAYVSREFCNYHLGLILLDWSPFL